MKTLIVTIRAELEVPDDWELAEHPSGIQALRIGKEFVDFDIAPLATTSIDPEAEWSDVESDIVQEVLDAVVGLEADLEIVTVH